MLNTQTIHSLDAPGLELYRTLRMPLEHQRQGLFVAEGEKVVRQLLESELLVVSLLLTPEWLSVFQLLLESRRERIDVFVAQKEVVEAIVGFNLHQGLMAVGKIPQPAGLHDVLQHSTRPFFFVAIDGLTNSENLGVLVRNCAGFGVQALLVGETSSSPYLRRAVRNSMGTVFKLPIIHVANLVGTLNELRTAHGIRCVAAHPHGTGETLRQTDFRHHCCVVFGSEDEGISAEVLAACDAQAAIPMHNGVDSLNVASASAAFLYEVVRQRNVASDS